MKEKKLSAHAGDGTAFLIDQTTVRIYEGSLQGQQTGSLTLDPRAMIGFSRCLINEFCTDFLLGQARAFYCNVRVLPVKSEALAE